jgi:glycosyltransferase involved in cell wall biosynthesis
MESAMKLLCYTQNLEIGGTQVNAIEIASLLRDRYGFEVIIFAVPGPMVELIASKKLSYVPAPVDFNERGSALNRLVLQEKPDLVHVWDHWQVEHAFYRVCIPLRVPIIVTCMEMAVPPSLPRSLPTTFGTPDLQRQARDLGFRSPHLLLPPVDVSENAPGIIDSSNLVNRIKAGTNEILVALVSRLVPNLKGESLYDSFDAIRSLGSSFPVRLLVVGEGEERPKLKAYADRINDQIGREAITLFGPLVDPRPAYEAAHVVIGMGGSALRGMAFGKPVIVVGAGGFAQTLTPETASYFYEFGIYGRSQRKSAESNLAAELMPLLQSERRRAELGLFSRDFVVRNYSLEALVEKFASLSAQVSPIRISTRHIISDVVQLKGGIVRCSYLGARRALKSIVRTKNPADVRPS